MNPRAAALLALVVGGGCFRHHTISITGREIHRHLRELDDRGVAVVDTNHHRDPGPTTILRERLYVDQKVYVDGRMHPISDMFDSCPVTFPVYDAGEAAAHCELIKRKDEPFLLRSYDSFRPGATLAAVGSLSAIGGIGYLASTAADSTSGKLEAGFGTALGTALVVGIVWLFVDCSGRWGSPGCRD